MCLLIVILLNLILFSSYSFAETPSYNKILSIQDVKVYKQIFDIQKKSIKSKNSKEWIRVDSLIKKVNNKILIR